MSIATRHRAMQVAGKLIWIVNLRIHRRGTISPCLENTQGEKYALSHKARSFILSGQGEIVRCAQNDSLGAASRRAMDLKKKMLKMNGAPIMLLKTQDQKVWGMSMRAHG